VADATVKEPEAHTFQAEARTLLDLMINSLYTHREVFLRELISNASDALDKLRVRALTDDALMGEQKQLEVVITADPEAKTLTISDTGIGMTKDELRDNLGTIARSGSREFVEQIKAQNSEGGTDAAQLIGQFGVGFYSAFLVAEKVEVVTRAAGADDAWRWTSTADGTYTIEPATREARGTDLVLHLRDEHEEYLSTHRLRSLITKYSDFVGHSIKLTEQKTEGEGDEQTTVTTQEVVNKGKALWTRSKDDITDEQYEEFYKHLSHDFEAPLTRSHFKVEGRQMFTGLLYLPKRPPFDLHFPKSRAGLRLYVKRVFVMDDCEQLIPEYLRFVRGVIDSDDLPLNVSREILQQEQAVEGIKRQVVKKTLDMLEELADERKADYDAFWGDFGNVLKEGLQADWKNKDRLAKLLRFESSADEGLTSLSDYVERMPEGQKAIYYITGPSKEFVAKSPHIEGLKAKGYEVLYFVDAIDEWVAEGVREFEGKQLVSAMKGELELDDEASKEDAEKQDETPDEWKQLVQAVKDTLGDRISDVKMSSRLTESPVCLVAGQFDMSANLERILRAANRPVEGGKRVFELNGDHALIKNLDQLAKDDAHRVKFKEWVEVLYEQALLTEGSPLADPSSFAQRMTALLLEASQKELGS